jgi:hypothetical protein
MELRIQRLVLSHFDRVLCTRPVNIQRAEAATP